MIFFVGEHPRQLDERGRFILPAKIRDKLSGTFYVTMAPLEHCLHIYPEEEWEIIAQKFSQLPAGTDRKVASLRRKIFGNAIECIMDKQGRVSLNQTLMHYAGIDKDIVLVGANTILEIWDAEEWESMNTDMNDESVIEGIRQYDINI